MLPTLLENVPIGYFRAPNCSTQVTHGRKLSSSAPYGRKMAVLGTSTQINMLGERKVYSDTNKFFFGLSAPWPTPALFLRSTSLLWQKFFPQVMLFPLICIQLLYDTLFQIYCGDGLTFVTSHELVWLLLFLAKYDKRRALLQFK